MVYLSDSLQALNQASSSHGDSSQPDNILNRAMGNMAEPTVDFGNYEELLEDTTTSPTAPAITQSAVPPRVSESTIKNQNTTDTIQDKNTAAQDLLASFDDKSTAQTPVTATPTPSTPASSTSPQPKDNNSNSNESGKCFNLDMYITVIKVLDAYRDLPLGEQTAVNQFLMALLDDPNFDSSSNAQVVKHVIELDRAIKDGVNNVITIKSMEPREQLLAILDLTAEQKLSMWTILTMVGCTTESLKIEGDNIDSIKSSVTKISDAINVMELDKVNILAPVNTILQNSITDNHK